MSTPTSRRPATRKGRPVLTRDAIAATALEIVGEQGHQALTMRSLAAELGVTVRAVYHHVDDRRQVIHLALDLMLDSWDVPPMSPDAWESSVAAYAGSLRALYRRWPRALLVAVDDDEPPSTIHPRHLVGLDRFLQLLHDTGLSVAAAFDVHRHLSLLVSSFVLLVDHRADRSGTGEREEQVPRSWVEAHQDLDLPALREAAALPVPTPDEQFDSLVADVTARIAARLDAAR